MRKKLLKSLEKCIESAWKEGVKNDYKNTAMWWKEAEIVASFYHHLCLNLCQNKELKKSGVQPISEYRPKPTEKREGKEFFPALKKDKSDPRGRAKSLDLCIAEFVKHDKEELWENEHHPLVAMEFKYWVGKEDIDQLTKIQNYIDNYEGFDEKYFCFVEMQRRLQRLHNWTEKIKDKKKLKKWRIAYLIDDGNRNPLCSVVSLDEFLKLVIKLRKQKASEVA